MWHSVQSELPHKYETVMCQDDKFKIFKGIFVGGNVGFIDVETNDARSVKFWIELDK